MSLKYYCHVINSMVLSSVALCGIHIAWNSWLIGRQIVKHLIMILSWLRLR